MSGYSVAIKHDGLTAEEIAEYRAMSAAIFGAVTPYALLHLEDGIYFDHN